MKINLQPTRFCVVLLNNADKNFNINHPYKKREEKEGLVSSYFYLREV
jgi:hypothetical protein